jgi:hypothetical protein
MRHVPEEADRGNTNTARFLCMDFPRRAGLDWPVSWLFFYLFGATLLSIPSSYHEGTVWIDRWWK